MTGAAGARVVASPAGLTTEPIGGPRGRPRSGRCAGGVPSGEGVVPLLPGAIGAQNRLSVEYRTKVSCVRAGTGVRREVSLPGRIGGRTRDRAPVLEKGTPWFGRMVRWTSRCACRRSLAGTRSSTSWIRCWRGWGRGRAVRQFSTSRVRRDRQEPTGGEVRCPGPGARADRAAGPGHGVRTAQSVPAVALSTAGQITSIAGHQWMHAFLENLGEW